MDCNQSVGEPHVSSSEEEMHTAAKNAARQHVTQRMDQMIYQTQNEVTFLTDQAKILEQNIAEQMIKLKTITAMQNLACEDCEIARKEKIGLLQLRLKLAQEKKHLEHRTQQLDRQLAENLARLRANPAFLLLQEEHRIAQKLRASGVNVPSLSVRLNNTLGALNRYLSEQKDTNKNNFTVEMILRK